MNGSGANSVTGSGSGRESPGGKSQSFFVSKERMAAMREAGIDFEDPKVRARMVKRFREQDAAAG